VLFAAQKRGELATTGAYGRLRHPQYMGLILIMVGFLLQWPTLATLIMFPVLVVVYRRLALREERDVRAAFGAAYDTYAAATPRFLPHVRNLSETTMAMAPNDTARYAGDGAHRPAFAGSEGGAPSQPGIQQPAGHMGHHPS
jgi:hypothetical protein